MFLLSCCCAVNVEPDKKDPEAGSLPSISAAESPKNSPCVTPKPEERSVGVGSKASVGIGLVVSTSQVLVDPPRPEVPEVLRQTSEATSNPARQTTDSSITSVKDDLMPYRKKSRRLASKNNNYSSMITHADDGETVLSARKSINCLNLFLNGSPVTKNNITVGLSVVRGPDWSWGAEDGGSGQGGAILAFDEYKGTVTVAWQTTSHVGTQYRYGAKSDLLVAQQEQVVDVDFGLAFGKRDSQFLFADKSQTIIVFDWDDTLFPTHYVRDELELEYNKPMRDQNLNSKYKAQVTKNLAKCEKHVIDLMKLASGLGKVILVTLARNPWVAMSCNNFYPNAYKLIEQMKVPVVYAQSGVQVDYDKIAMGSNDEIERYWSEIKGRAIAREVKRFYSQYEGQSWKNIISIGDSDFERLGTQAATAEYMKQTGLGDAEAEVDGHMFKVRTKTFKLLDEPTIEELTVEVSMLMKWVPLMVDLDKSFDVNLENVEDAAMLQRIEETLQGVG